MPEYFNSKLRLSAMRCSLSENMKDRLFSILKLRTSILDFYEFSKASSYSDAWPDMMFPVPNKIFATVSALTILSLLDIIIPH